MACAGIIAAAHNNLGVAGIAPNSQIIPVNIFRGFERAADIASGINFAWDPNRGNADVLSNSWAYGSPLVEADVIRQAINNALTQGRVRNGQARGCIVVFSSGNSNLIFPGVLFPANIPGVITVGAINANGAIWNYSSRGPEMDLVAPSGGGGNQVSYQGCQIPDGNIVTIDRMGDLGYTADNNTFTFNGTSAACPQVAGVAALMLSLNPNLTQNQVRTMLQQSATDMGAPGFDDAFGFGRLNARRAVDAALQAALQETTIASSVTTDVVCGTATFTLQSTTGSIVGDWNVVPSTLFSGATSGTNASSITLTRNGSSNGSAILIFTRCGNEIARRVFQVGAYRGTEFSIFPDYTGNTVCTNSVHEYGTRGPAGATNYQWFVPSGWSILAGQGTSFIVARVSSGTVGGSVGVRVDNACGIGTGSALLNVRISNCGGGAALQATAYNAFPNPADQYVDITLPTASVEPDEYEPSTTEATVQIYNRFSQLVCTGQTVKGILRLDTSKLPNGQYFIHIHTNSWVSQQHLIVQR
jgi:subtilisin family serine protease